MQPDDRNSLLYLLESMQPDDRNSLLYLLESSRMTGTVHHDVKTIHVAVYLPFLSPSVYKAL